MIRLPCAPLDREVEWFDGVLAEKHYLGAGRAVGDYLRQIVEVDAKAVALLVWGPGCYALKDRDNWISWSKVQRLERLKLIVQNRRFLVLADKGQSLTWRPKLDGSGSLVLVEPVAGALWLRRCWQKASPIRRPAGTVTRPATGKRWGGVLVIAGTGLISTCPMTGQKSCGCGPFARKGASNSRHSRCQRNVVQV